MAKANGWKALTIIKKNSNQDPAKVLDPILIIIKVVYKLNGLEVRRMYIKLRNCETNNNHQDTKF